MQIFELKNLIHERAQTGRRYLEFLRAPEMSLGVYVLSAGGVDPQQPHAEAEAYYVVSGRAAVTVDGETEPVAPGTTIFVPAKAEHRFHDIIEDLTLLVFFAPPEGSLEG